MNEDEPRQLPSDVNQDINLPTNSAEQSASAGAPSEQEIEEARIESGLSIAEREKRSMKENETDAQSSHNRSS